MWEWARVNHALLRLIADVILTDLALFIAGLIVRLPGPSFALASQVELPLVVYILAAGLWVVISLALSIYKAGDQRAVDEAQMILVSTTVTTLALAAALFFLFPQVSRLQILLFCVVQFSLVAGLRLTTRLTLRVLGHPRYARRRVLILGARAVGCEAATMLERNRWTGLELVGFLDDEVPAHTMVLGYPVLGKVQEIADQVRTQDIQEVVIALPFDSYDRFFSLLGSLQELPAQIRFIPDHFRSFLFHPTTGEFANMPVITLQKPGLTHFERQIKRTFDLVFGGLLLVLVSPLLLLIAIAIRLDSAGVVLFRQQRVGENGKLFDMIKFRSMVQGADGMIANQISVSNEGDLLYKRAADPRVTRVGRVLRRTSMDELPQLWNVLKGDMSLVGPRPELPWLVDRYEPWQRQRFVVPQGMTGWWQVNGRSDKPLHLHTEEDLFYIQNQSLLLDVLILWKTVGAVVKGRGAY